MRLLTALFCALTASVAVAADAPPPTPAKFALPEAPRVAFVGNTFVERDFQHGYLETRLIRAFPDKDVIFRNLGWSGDTVRGESRAGFGTPADGFKHLAKHLEDLKPNVVLMNYGESEAFAGPAGLDAFNSDLAKMLDLLSRDGARVVVLGIMRQENLGPPLPDPAAQNENVRLYNDALSKAAAARGMQFVDLYDLPGAFAKANPGKPFTDDEIHPTPAGYAFAGAEIARRMGVPDAPWGPADERVRRLTLEKNQLFFHRWRPQNETYIFGFRKKEQGRNAVEIPQFDPLIAAKEAEINRAKK